MIRALLASLPWRDWLWLAALEAIVIALMVGVGYVLIGIGRLLF
ncbi:MAG TPA: hypothetical protein VFH85_03520 [Gammaproteobacteria bacterium]|nr:hypothetical protein [Gammaproteobacteria bacterium]